MTKGATKTVHVKSPISIAGVRHEVGAEVELTPEEFLTLLKFDCVETLEERDARKKAEAEVEAARAKAEKSAHKAAEKAAAEAQSMADHARAEAEAHAAAERRRAHK